MCNNRNYTVAELFEIDTMRDYAVAVLTGSTLEAIAKSKSITVEEVKKALTAIKEINPDLYMQVKEKVNLDI